MKRVIRIEMEALVTITCAGAVLVAGDPQFNAFALDGSAVAFAATQTAANICVIVLVHSHYMVCVVVLIYA